MIIFIKWKDLKEVSKLYPNISFDEALTLAKDLARTRMWKELYEKENDNVRG